jgi:non-ribosomal peptide synthetase-like protein
MKPFVSTGAPSAPAQILTATAFSNIVRSVPGERFEHLFERRVDALEAAGNAGKLAIDSIEAHLSFADLDARANQVARYLRAQGIRPGDRLALLFDKSIYSYVATLAVLKIHAAYVPLDQSFPADRIAFICEDAECKAILSIARYREHLEPTGKPILFLDEAEAAIASEATGRLTTAEKGEPKEQLAYIIYTSGSTGKPKGVPIDHHQIVNFIKVAAEVYGIREDDRMYQGLTIAFDFAVEEIWVPLVIGATLVPGPTGARLVGQDLADFLAHKQVTAMCCVPTLLATLEADLPILRYIMVSGEACPQDLVARWQKKGRILLNAYGPTETTVTATLTALEAGKPVTIGAPLPTYSIVILDPAESKALPFGEAGEIGIAGVGVAKGYLNRDELTRKVFIPDFLNIPGNESGHIYRTGDLGRINAIGEIEYMGRIDTQVKIRGYRIELTEIESVLMQSPDIAQAVVDKYEPEPGAVELIGYYTLKPGVRDFDLDLMVETLRQRLPSYMVPAYFEQMETIPLLPSHKADRKKLPPPSGPRYGSRKGAVIVPATPMEKAMALALTSVLKTSDVSIEDHFFDVMGANSLLMAQFCTRLRESGLVADVSMRDTYQFPTIRGLAAHLELAEAEAPLPEAEEIEHHHASRFAFVMTGIAQAAVWLAYLTFTSWLFLETVDFTFDGTGALDIYLRAAGSTLGTTLLLVLVPIALKWILVGRWKAERFPIWGPKYFRFWLIKQLTRINPMALFNGTPLYNVYLRLLGARIGKNAVIVNGGIPVATDLISIGEGAVVSKSAVFSSYRSRAGWIETGPVTIGDYAFVGTASVLSINTEVGAGAQLGNVSSLHAGQSVPAGKRYHGSPAVETTTNYDRAGMLPVSPLRRVMFNLIQIVLAYLVLIPVPTALLLTLFPAIADLGDVHLDGTDVIPFNLGEIVGGSFLASIVLYLMGFLSLLAATWALPRFCGLFLKPGVTYPLYGLRYFLFRTLFRSSNSATLNNFFGDSSYITGFLTFLGWKLGEVKQTGSNFGSLQKQDVPSLTAIGTGTMVSDGLTMLNADVSTTGFMVREAKIGANNYLGNALYYPAGGKTGDNVLMGTKVLIPLDGEVRENIGLLGSPAFEIPRTVKRDTQFNDLREGPEFERRLAMKNRANLKTMGLYLVSRWLIAFIALTCFAVAIAEQPLFGPFALAGATIATLILSALATTFIEHWTLGFRPLEPKTVSIYDPYYWFHENHWKIADTNFLSLFNGTPLKGWAWRLVGVKVGKMLFDDGASFSEKSLVQLGDHVTLSEGAILQGHTMEDAAFKSDRIVLGNDVSVGSMAFMNYGVVMGDGSILEPDSFLMKGEQVPGGSVWGGNPARQLRA